MTALLSSARLAVPRSPYDALPLKTRVLERLTGMLILANELLAEFHTEEANVLLWLEPYIQRVYDDIDISVRRLAQ